MLTINDLNWQGYYVVPNGGSASSAAGTPEFSGGAIAVRYVDGERRFLIPTFKQADTSPTTQIWGDLVEYKAPVSSPYSGATPASAPELIETRRWADWTNFQASWAGKDTSSGNRIGSVYWDDAQGVLWYQIYGYYYSGNAPFLGATQLLDTTVSGKYRTVGTQYGPWWYRDNNPAGSNLYWKSVCYWIAPIPASAQSDLGGNQFIVGATAGSVNASGHVGPGNYAINLPSLSDPADSVIADGLHLTDYRPSAGPTDYPAIRDNNYTFVPWTDHSSSDTGLRPTSGATGYWQMSLDQVNTCVWVETATKHGLLMFGRIASGHTSYGFNPLSITPGWDGAVDILDPARTNPDNANSYNNDSNDAALWAFDPSQIREVGRGTRAANNTGINPVNLGDWKAKWPNILKAKYDGNSNNPPAYTSRPIYQNINNTGFWDTTAQELLWCNPCSYSFSAYVPVLNIFTVS